MTRKINAILLTVILILSILLSTGCKVDFGGEYPELCSTAWVNLPGVSGHSSNGEISYAPTVLVLETDSEGRRLFYYQEDRNPYWHILITQRSDDEKAYYYADDCYLSYPKGEEYWSIREEANIKDMVYECIPTEELSAFKTLNDWDHPINEAKCESTEILTRKSEGENNPGEARLEEYAAAYYESIGRYIHPKNIDLARFSDYVTRDSYGRELYIIESRVEDYGIKSETTYYYNLLMVIMPDGSCDTSTIIQVDNPHECRDAVKQIKADNNWNMPIK